MIKEDNIKYLKNLLSNDYLTQVLKKIKYS